MNNLPKKCLVNKFIPKTKFYDNLVISSSIKEEFVDQIERITWLYKLSPDTVGISKTEEIEEIEIFQIDLKNKLIPKNVIKIICKGIPYRILFKIVYENDLCYAIKPNDNIYYTNWNEDININFEGLNLNYVYENIVKKIIKKEDSTKSFEEILIDKTRIDDLKKRISQLENKVRLEKQFDRKLAYNMELNKLKKEMEELNNG